MLSKQNLVNDFLEDVLVSREFSLFFSFQHWHWLQSATGKNKLKSDFHLFLLSLNTYGQVCGTRAARYLLCKVLLMKRSSSGWSYNIKVDFVKCYLLCWCNRLSIKGLDVMTSNVSWSERCEEYSISLLKNRLKDDLYWSVSMSER